MVEDDATDLIVIADYLFLHDLKSLAENFLLLKLNVSNCLSSYYISERYHCEELSSKAKTIILKNFTSLYACNQEEVLNMSSKGLERLISSDEMHISSVSAEEDVFNIILAWINHDKSQQKKYFAQLFRRVRLAYVARELCTIIS